MRPRRPAPLYQPHKEGDSGRLCRFVACPQGPEPSASPPRTPGSRPTGHFLPRPSGIGAEGLSKSWLILRDRSVAQPRVVIQPYPSGPIKLAFSLCPPYRQRTEVLRGHAAGSRMPGSEPRLPGCRCWPRAPVPCVLGVSGSLVLHLAGPQGRVYVRERQGMKRQPRDELIGCSFVHPCIFVCPAIGRVHVLFLSLAGSQPWTEPAHCPLRAVGSRGKHPES